MLRPISLVLAGALALAIGAAMLPGRIDAQSSGPDRPREDARAALERAESDRRSAGRRAEMLEREAAEADKAADRAVRESAALAARIQQAEAAITAAEARVALIQGQQAVLDLQLAERREPLMHLTAALQRIARRPLALSAFRPGTLEDAVYLRAMLATTLPQVERQTRGLRSELDRSQRLAARAGAALKELRATERTLADRRRRLATLSARQRVASRQAGLAARREAERAFALAEEARDLESLVGELERAGALRARLASLPGPVLRPVRPDRAAPAMRRTPAPAAPAGTSAAAPRNFRLPVDGRVVAGFGAQLEGGVRTAGLVLAPRQGAVAVAPASGRVAYAGPYRGYGRIVILEHGEGWTSLLTGLARVDVAVGEQLASGSPVGTAPARNPRIGLELRRQGEPVNPLRFIG